METIDRKLAFDTPATVFVHPMRVVQSSQLSHDDKVVVLRNWKCNLEKLRDLSDDETAAPQPDPHRPRGRLYPDEGARERCG